MTRKSVSVIPNCLNISFAFVADSSDGNISVYSQSCLCQSYRLMASAVKALSDPPFRFPFLPDSYKKNFSFCQAVCNPFFCSAEECDIA